MEVLVVPALVALALAALVLVALVFVEVLAVVVLEVVVWEVEALVALLLVALLLVALVLMVVVLIGVVLVALVFVAKAFKSQVLDNRDFHKDLLNKILSIQGFSHQKRMSHPPSTQRKLTGHLSIPDLKCQLMRHDNVPLLRNKIVIQQYKDLLV
jgi:hypothetical protein